MIWFGRLTIGSSVRKLHYAVSGFLFILVTRH
jgi:hypothetical protein